MTGRTKPPSGAQEPSGDPRMIEPALARELLRFVAVGEQDLSDILSTVPEWAYAQGDGTTTCYPTPLLRALVVMPEFRAVALTLGEGVGLRDLLDEGFCSSCDRPPRDLATTDRKSVV